MPLSNEERFNRILDAADEALTKTGGIAMEASALELEVTELSDEYVKRLWEHLTVTAIALAVLHEDTPRTILEEAFQHVPDDEAWRADLERRLRKLRGE